MPTDTMPSITVATIAKDEERHIARALESVRELADEIVVVVDDRTTDRTAAIARDFTDKVLVRPWPGFGAQKNFALQQATSEWALFVDADEEVPEALAAELRTTLARQPHIINTAFVKIVTVFLGRPLRHVWGTNPRVLRRSAVTWDNRAVHEQVVRADDSTVRLGDPDTVLIRTALHHPSHYATLAAYRERRERYTSRDAEEMRKTGRDRLGKPLGNPRSSPLVTARFLSERAFKQFIRLFVRKRGFLDGWQGWLWCGLSAQYEYMMCKKYLVLLKQSQISGADTS